MNLNSNFLRSKVTDSEKNSNNHEHTYDNHDCSQLNYSNGTKADSDKKVNSSITKKKLLVRWGYCDWDGILLSLSIVISMILVAQFLAWFSHSLKIKKDTQRLRNPPWIPKSVLLKHLPHRPHYLQDTFCQHTRPYYPQLFWQPNKLNQTKLHLRIVLR